MEASEQIRVNLASARKALLSSLNPDQRLLYEYVASTELLLSAHSNGNVAKPISERQRNRASRLGSTREALLKALDANAYRPVNELAAELGKSFNATSAALRGMLTLGLVEGGGRRGYKLAPPDGAQGEETDSTDSQLYSSGSGLSQGETAVSAVVSPTTSS